MVRRCGSEVEVWVVIVIVVVIVFLLRRLLFDRPSPLALEGLFVIHDHKEEWRRRISFEVQLGSSSLAVIHTYVLSIFG